MGAALVTGGAGYIGSHTVLVLLEAGWDVTVIDDLSNSSARALEEVASIVGRAPTFVHGDVQDAELLAKVFAQREFDGVVHFAGLKAVGESVGQPLRYYQTNLGSTLTLLSAMEAAGVFQLVFSSSCTVYDATTQPPFREDGPLATASPYGTTKLLIEEICRDLASVDDRWHIALLRYFNPVGAHPSGRIGEDPTGEPLNLMPITMQVAVGVRPQLQVFGDDYPTRDGTCIRDYIHVMDLSDGHRAALDSLVGLGPGCRAVNLGTGTGSTVLEVVRAAEDAVGAPIAHEITYRRPGDVPAAVADVAKARELLGWEATLTLADMCQDHWRWQQAHPRGYEAD